MGGEKEGEVVVVYKINYLVKRLKIINIHHLHITSLLSVLGAFVKKS